MAHTNYEIDNYLMFHENADFISRYDIICRILCQKGTELKGILYFYKEGVTIPPSSKSSSEKLYLRFPANQMSDIIETLRQEKPLYIRYEDTYNYGALQTSKEPIGEEES